ncbi:hypothetical protein XBKQ1_2070001 [Xenorhabdus bovienii str. kraussei Quebec]|uniref:Uncharacterized protein n=1 Tax=Xenorhabdus bovienii str. kraussei Quebec TaxID=1398203 RepID=A0A077PFC2_XENBV|nr:hypothetical protein [Xenorhabdus bovienii]CDH19322.1 hypothetical protein XBKQ1_2070001 [Xenorhabdus bovienii str. kraussei Quebec]
MYIFRGKIDWFQYANNEAFTLIFPNDIAFNEPAIAIWQWSWLDDGSVKVPTNREGIIDGLVRVDSKLHINITCDYYKFDAVLSDDKQSILLTMKTGDGTSSSQTTLSLSYSLEEYGSECDIYSGKLSWSGYAENQTITVVAPKKLSAGAPIFTYWQWDNKNNIDIIGTVDVFSENTDSAGAKIEFFNDQYYKFRGTVNNQSTSESPYVIDQGLMCLNMRNSEGYTSLDINLELVWSNASISRKKRWLGGTTKTTVINDTDDIYYCTLADKQSDVIAIRDAALTLIGGATAFVGICTLPVSGPVASVVAGVIGGAATIIGAAASAPNSIEVISSFWDGRPPHSRVLMSEDWIYREGNTKTIGPAPANQLTITKLSIEHKTKEKNIIVNKLVIKKGFSEPLYDGQYLLANLLEQGKITWDNNPILQLQLGEGSKQIIESCALVTFNGFLPIGGSKFEADKDIFLNMEQKPVGFMFSYEKNNNPNNPNKLDGLTHEWSDKLQFIYGENPKNRYFTVIHGPGNPIFSGNNALVTLPTDRPENQSPIFFWKLSGYGIAGAGTHDSRPLGSVGTQSDVLRKISQDMANPEDNFSLLYAKIDNSLVAYNKNKLTLVPSSGSTEIMYIKVEQVTPFQRLKTIP